MTQSDADHLAELEGPPLRIAEIGPLFESIPPTQYGGTERVVSYLTEALVCLGHDVTLFASGDSVTKAKLVAPCPRSLRLDDGCRDAFPHYMVMLEKVFEDTSRFDVMHFHIDYLHFSLCRRQVCPHVTTLHGRQDIPDLVPLYQTFPEMPFISISNDQRRPFPGLNWQATIYHGLPENLYRLQEKPGNYLAFLGRMSPEKGAVRAIDIARRVGMDLKMAAKIDKPDYEYFKSEVEPRFRDAPVEFLGEIGGKDKEEFLRNAHALLFTIDWPEPFGLVMIEAMACGTPVIAWRNGSVAEVIDDGVTGVIVDDLDDAVGAVETVGTLDRAACRRMFEERFSAARMTRDHVALYRRLAAGGQGALSTGRQGRRSNVFAGAASAEKRGTLLSQRP